MVRTNVYWTLSKTWGQPEAVRKCLRVEHADSTASVRGDVVHYLRDIGPSATYAEPVFLELLKDSRQEVRGLAACAIGITCLKSPILTTELPKLLHDADSMVRSSAVGH